MMAVVGPTWDHGLGPPLPSSVFVTRGKCAMPHGPVGMAVANGHLKKNAKIARIPEFGWASSTGGIGTALWWWVCKSETPPLLCYTVDGGTALGLAVSSVETPPHFAFIAVSNARDGLLRWNHAVVSRMGSADGAAAPALVRDVL